MPILVLCLSAASEHIWLHFCIWLYGCQSCYQQPTTQSIDRSHTDVSGKVPAVGRLPLSQWVQTQLGARTPVSLHSRHPLSFCLFVCLFVSFYCRHCPAVLKLRLFKAVEGIAKTRIFLLIYFYLFYTSKLHFPTCATLLFKCRYFTVLLHHRKVM